MVILKPLIDQAIARGVSEQVFVAVLLLPLVATFISAMRYLVGIRGLGIFTPVLLAGVLWMAGINLGLYLFLVIMTVATLALRALAQTKLHYLARMALLFWFICLGVLVILLELDYSLWPLLLLIFLTQDFVKIQLAKPFRVALGLSIETMILGLVGALPLSWPRLQQFALTQPEVVILGTAVLNFLVGRFAGLRLLEYRRFRRLFK